MRRIEIENDVTFVWVVTKDGYPRRVFRVEQDAWDWMALEVALQGEWRYGFDKSHGSRTTRVEAYRNEASVFEVTICVLDGGDELA